MSLGHKPRTPTILLFLTWLLLSAGGVGGYAVLTRDALLKGNEYWWWILWLGPALIAIPLVFGVVIVAVCDLVQTHEPIRRMFPVAFWARKFLTASGAPLRQYLFSSDHEETPFNRITRNWIYQTSSGKRDTIGFGSQEDMERIGSFIALPATFTNSSTKEGDTVGRGYRRVIGERTGVTPVVLTHFAHITAMSYGALSYRAHAALNRGAAAAGILHNTGEGSLAPCHEEGGADLVFQIGTAKYGIRTDDGKLDEEKLRKIGEHPQVKMFEIKLAQGAKPGKGGMLLKEKITPEIAKIREIPMGVDSHSPPRHAEFSDVNGLFDFIDRVRSITGKPVGIKMVIGHTEEIESIARKIADDPSRGPDYIVIDGGEGGTGAAPLVLASHAGLPMKQAIAVADWALRQAGARDQITLFASGRIATPIDVTVAMALGADAVYMGRGFLFALGCIQALECHSNKCPTGIATQNPRLQKALAVEAAAERVANYARSIYKDTQLLAESMGYDSPDQVKPDDIMVVTSPGHLDYLSELHGVSAFEASSERRRAGARNMSVGEMKMRMNQEADLAEEALPPARIVPESPPS